MKPIYLFVTPFFPSPDSWRGGYCYDMVKALQRTAGDRYDVRVFVPGTGPDYQYSGIQVNRFKRQMLPFGLAPFLSHLVNKKHFAATLDRLGVKWPSVEVCHVHTLDFAYVTELAKEKNAQCITLLHHHCINPVRLVSGRLGIVPLHATILYFYWRRLCEQVDVHVFCSAQSRASYGMAYRNGVPERGFVRINSYLWFGRFFRAISLNRSAVLYNGIDRSIFLPKSKRAPNSKFVIGCVANFQPLKDQMTLIKAVEYLTKSDDLGRDICVRFVGSGQCLSTCQKYVGERGLCNVVCFEREIDHLSLPDFYRSLDLFVLPSRTEGFCCAYVEAAGCGVPVIGCRGVSIEEVIPQNDREKWLIEPMDVDDLAQKIKAYMKREWAFAFSRSLDIDDLWREFAVKIDGWRMGNA